MKANNFNSLENHNKATKKKVVKFADAKMLDSLIEKLSNDEEIMHIAYLIYGDSSEIPYPVWNAIDGFLFESVAGLLDDSNSSTTDQECFPALEVIKFPKSVIIACYNFYIQ